MITQPPTHVGLDIGGTKIYAARYSGKWKVQKDILLPTDSHRGKQAVLDNIKTALDAVVDTATTRAIGIAWAGFVDSKKGTVIKAPNIHSFHNVPVASLLKRRYKIPVVLENDARLFTLAEQQLGCAKKKSHVVGVIIGTGVGAGIIIDGKLFRGSGGFAGEVGHMLASHHPITEVESIIAGPALNRLFTRQANIRSFDEAVKKCKARDVRICALLEPVLDATAAFLYNVILAYDPEIIVIGGGIGTNLFSIFSGQVERKVKALLLRGGYPNQTKIEYSTMENAGSVGAALYAFDSC